MKVLIADDSVLFRKVMADVVSALPGAEVVGHAPNGKIALQKVRECQPDLLTLDMEMPELDGLAVLDELKKLEEAPLVIVVSAQTLQGGRLTIQALQRGAFDFVTKPDTASAERSRALLTAELAPRIKALSLRLGVRNILRVPAGGAAAGLPADGFPPAAYQRQRDLPEEAPPSREPGFPAPAKPEAVLVGVSTGGPNALAALVPALPADLGIPVLIVQHMPPLFTRTLAENLAAKSALRVREAENGEAAEPNTVYIAPGGRHMRLAAGSDGTMRIQITDDPPENNCRPAVDYLFRSAANHFPGRCLAVILTGMGSDGALGLRLLKRRGCVVIAQDEATSVVYGMPKAAFDAGVVDHLLPLDKIAGRIADIARGEAR